MITTEFREWATTLVCGRGEKEARFGKAGGDTCTYGREVVALGRASGGRGVVGSVFLFLAVLLAWICPAMGGAVHEVVSSFGATPSNPRYGALVLGSDGYFWGTTENGGAYGYGTIYKVKADGSEWQTVTSFTGEGWPNRGAYPKGGLVSDRAGSFWGTTSRGGSRNAGTVFKINQSTGELTTVAEFAYYRSEGPYASLVSDGAGSFWGTTTRGGANIVGTVYKINQSTGELTIVVEFNGAVGSNRGAEPVAALVADGAGFFWGTTLSGGAHRRGTIFKIDPSTGDLTTVVDFTGDGASNRGAHPYASLVSDGAGALWGTTSAGGEHGYGTVFKINESTGELTTVVDFIRYGEGDRGANPYAGLVSDGAGFFWGTTASGGAYWLGTIFKINQSTGELTTVVDINGAGSNEQGAYPEAGLVSDGAGSLWGTTSISLVGGAYVPEGTVFRVNQSTGELTTVVNFPSESGVDLVGGLVSDGTHLWGTTTRGGGNNRGKVFKINPKTGKRDTVVEFTGNGAMYKGSYPHSDLVSDGAGSIWGATRSGGAFDMGTVFRIDGVTGEMTTVVEFTGNGASNKGASPNVGLVSDGTGSIWGATEGGGAYGKGTVFKIEESTGELTTVVEFTGNGAYNKGATPNGGLVRDGAGSFWGTTGGGGADNKGTVFKIEESTGELTTVVEFTGNGTYNKGATPNGGLVSDGAGSFWGTTGGGGTDDKGTVFKINERTGELTTVVEFTGNGASNKGRSPYAGLVSDGAGSFWGTTHRGGASDYGTVFKVNGRTGELTTVIEFTGHGVQRNTGKFPYSRLILHSDGNLYGTTSWGGPNSYGTVFRIRRGPTPVTRPATEVSPHAAILNGTVNPNDEGETAVQFEYGTDPELVGALTTSATTIASGSSAVAFAATIEALASSTRYYFRVTGSNAGNGVEQKGYIMSFTTPNAPPVADAGGPYTVEAGRGLGLSGTGAYDTDAGDSIVGYDWDLTDDGVYDVAGESPAVSWAQLQAAGIGAAGLYTVRLRVTDSAGNTATGTASLSVQDTTAPTIGGTFSPLSAVAGRALPDYTGQAETEDNLGVVNITQTPAPGSLHDAGTVRVTLKAFDAAGLTAEVSFEVEMRPGNPQAEAIAFSGTGGSGIIGQPAGSRYEKLGIPSVNDAGKLAFLARISGPFPAFEAILAGTDPAVLVRAGDAADGTAGAVFKSFKDPLLNRAGAVAFVARLAGSGVLASNDCGLWADAFGAGVQMVAREGDPAQDGGGAKLSGFKSVALESGTGAPHVAYHGKLTGAGVDAANDEALWSFDGTATRLLLREGASVMVGGSAKKLAGFTVLGSRCFSGAAEAVPGEITPAEGAFLDLPTKAAGQGFGLANGVMTALLKFNDKTLAVATIHADGSDAEIVAVTGDAAPEFAAGAFFKSFRARRQNSLGGAVFAATIGGAGGSGGTAAVYAVKGGAGGELERIAAKGDVAAGLGGAATFKAFKAAVNNSDDRVAFTAVAGGVPATGDLGVWVWDGAGVVLVAREGEPAAECDGATWKCFNSLAVADGGGVLFVGKLKVGTGSPAAGGADDRCLWGRDLYGNVRLLVREGVTAVGSKTVKGFKVLGFVSGSASQTRSHNGTGGIVYLATFTDGTQGIVKVQMP